MLPRFQKRSPFNYSTLEPRQLLAADLSTATLSTADYSIPDIQQELAARDYLANSPETSSLQKSSSNLSLVEIQRGLASTVTRFQQTIHGVPVVGAWVSTIQGPSGDFVLVHDQSQEGVFDTTCDVSKGSIDFETSETTALDHAGAVRTFAPTRGNLAWLTGEGNDKTATLVWQTTVFGVTADGDHGDFLTFVDAVTGDVISQENRIAHFTDGSGDVFYPNPYQTQGSAAGLTDNNDASSIALQNQLVPVTLQGLDEGTGLIRGEFVDLSTLNGTTLPDVDANEPTRIYNYDRDDPRFEQVVIYHTVDQISRYFHDLGFDDDTGTQNGIRDFPTLANAHWDNADNSFYSTGDDAIHFGDGGVDDGEDGDIVAHEYGHAIQHNQNAAWGGGEMGAMGEGFGDYLAASFFQGIGDAAFQASHAAAVGEWDATSYSSDDPPNLRRVDGNKMYPVDLTGGVHADGEIWSRALWDLNQDIGAAAADQLVLESHFLVPGGSSMVTAAEMILLADQNLNGGQYESNIRAAFEARGILEAPETIGSISLDSSVYSPGSVIEIEVIDANAAANIEVMLTSSNGDSETLTLSGSTTYSTTISSVAGTPAAGDGQLQAMNGDTFTVTYIDVDDGAGNSITASDTGAFQNITVYDSDHDPIAIVDNSTISSTITVTDAGSLLDVDLQLDITHTWDSDLTAVLTAPNGTEYTLFDGIGGSGDNFTATTFDDDADTAIGNGTAPFTGTFRSQDPLAPLNDTSITGDWTLSITDSATFDTGSLNSWSLFLVVEAEDSIAAPEIAISDGTNQRSVVDQLVVSFDEVVNVAPGAFELIQRGPNGGTVDVTPVIDNSSGATVVTLEFSGAFAGAAGLVDGNYQLTVLGDLITSSSGTAMDGDGDGVAGGDLVFGDTAADNFFRFYGDNNGDRLVNVFDLLAMRLTFGSTDDDANFNSNFDSNGDGRVNVIDLLAFRGNYLESMNFV